MPSIEEIKERLRNLSNKGKKANDIWKPKDEHIIRCLPYPHAEDPFIELHFHYEIGDVMSVLCPKANFGDDCVICDFSERLRSWTDENGRDKPEHLRKQDWEMFKKISAKPRWFTPVIERGKESEGVKFWGMPQTTLTLLLELCADSERNEDRDDKGGYLVLNSPDKAYDLEVSFCKPGEKGNNKTFPLTKVKGKMKTSRLSLDKKAGEELIKSVPHIQTVYPRVSSAQVEKIFGSFTQKSASESEVDVDTSTEYRPPAEKPAVGRSSVEETLNKLIEGLD